MTGIHIYLAPHLDDAVLSCGGTIHHRRARGEPVLVVTVFAGAPHGHDVLSDFALQQHRTWGDPPGPMKLRRAEDRAALVYLDAEFHHLDYLDAIYRTGPRDEWLYDGEGDIFGALHPCDFPAKSGSCDLAHHLSRLIPQHGAVAGVYAPLGVGHHVDHQITHTAARQLQAQGCPMAFYEDYPYGQQPHATEATLDALAAHSWRMELVPLTAADIAAKVAALGYYRSQMPGLFGGAKRMPSDVWAFAASHSLGPDFAERIWWPQAA